MALLKLNHWFVNSDKLSISLMRYYVNIKICKNDEFIFYRLEVYFDSKKELVFNFYSLEDAVTFVENTISKCNTIKEILESYKEQFENGKFKLLNKKLSKVIK